VLVIDDTGDRKKGHHTDYVKRQYIGNKAKIENGIVAVTAYGVVDHIHIALAFINRRTPQGFGCLPQQARDCRQMMRELQAMGFRFKLVLADSLYGGSGCGSSMCCMS